MNEEQTMGSVNPNNATAFFSLPALLRWLGCGGVVLSAVVFLLQGFESVDVNLRSWAYLGLMMILGGVGIGLRFLFSDGKGARLLLALAAAVIPIQFAQLGGMIHGLVTNNVADAAPGFLSFITSSDLSWSLVGVCALVTYCLSFVIGLFSFKVLARQRALFLALANLVLCSILLIPLREGAMAIPVLVALGLATFLADRRSLRDHIAHNTMEGRTARVILLIPFTIAIVRLGFYLNDVASFALLIGVGAIGAITAAQVYVRRVGLREVIFAVAAVWAVLAWVTWSNLVLNFPCLVESFVIGPVAGLFLLIVATLSHYGAIYRSFACLPFMAAGIDLALSGGDLIGPLASAALALGLSAVGYVYKWRAPVLSGLILLAIAVGCFLVAAFAHIEVGTWIGLAVGGVALVVMASVIEKYGRLAGHRLQTSWAQIRSWD